jgi:hypothetical protein
MSTLTKAGFTCKEDFNGAIGVDPASVFAEFLKMQNHEKQKNNGYGDVGDVGPDGKLSKLEGKK